MQTETTETTATPKRYQCRHIFTDGHRCGSPCLRREELCYYHHTTRRPAENPTERRARMSTFALPLPEDRSAIQHAIGEVLQRIAANAIDPKRAGLLLYGLQIASLNLPKAPETNRTTAPVEEIVTHPHLGTLAPRTEVIPEETPLSPLAQIVAELQRGHSPQPEEPAPESQPAPEPQPEPWLIPNLQACEDNQSNPYTFIHNSLTQKNLILHSCCAMIEVAMKRANWKTATIALLMTLGLIANAANHPEPALSAAQTAAVSRQIATLKSSVDRNVAQNWSNTKKVAELICRPAALPVLKKQAKGADRVFLGTDAPASLTLESNQRLTGTGQVRTPQGWQDFTFTCNLNPATGKVTDFQTVPH